MKKYMSLILAAMLLFTLTACGGETSDGPTRLGTSGFSIVLPEGFAPAKDDFDADQVAYFYKDDESIDFDVYQWAKEGKYELESEAEYFAAEYGTTPAPVTVNGIEGMKYVTTEEYDGYAYTVINYMFDDGENIVELCFWTVNTQEELAAVEEIIGTLSAN